MAQEEVVVTQSPALDPTVDAAETPASPKEEGTDSIIITNETRALEELKSLLQSAIANSELSADAPDEDVTIWGAPVMNDTVLVKFLTAREFKPKEALAMIKNTVAWRREFGVEKLLAEDASGLFDGVVFMSGTDREGHPVCYNVYGEFQNKEVYDKAFAEGETFLRWRIQFLEKGIRELLDFGPAGGVSTMVQVTDLKNSPGLLNRELRHALDILQNNYPEFVKKQVFINVPWWYLAFNRMISPFLTQRTKSKFVFAGPSKSVETLFSYISPEQVPVQFGGLKNENEYSDFTVADVVTEINMKPNSKEIIEIPVTKKCILVWELRVLGWDVTLGAEFVPSSKDGYTVIVEKSKKWTASDEAVKKTSFKIGEPGKVVLTVDNAMAKKKKVLLYRYKIKDSTCEI